MAQNNLKQLGEHLTIKGVLMQSFDKKPYSYGEMEWIKQDIMTDG